MSKEQYTLGPWSEPERPFIDQFNHSGGHYTVDVDHLEIFIADGDEEQGDDYIEIHGPNQQANARLIAAAPELIEALHCALPFVEDAITSPDFKAEYVKKVLLEINAALMKANGE